MGKQILITWLLLSIGNLIGYLTNGYAASALIFELGITVTSIVIAINLYMFKD